MMINENTILAYTDGACAGNPGPGGFGAILVFPDGYVKELGGRKNRTTNNAMEIMAIIKSLETIADALFDVWVLTDSTYVIRGINQWIWGWKKRGWVTSKGDKVINKPLWQRLDQLVSARKTMGSIEWKYVRGHAGVPANERCDEIAVAFSKRKYPKLYSGSLLKYTIPVHDFPEDMGLPPMTEQKEKKKAYSYLVYSTNGRLERYETWPECEAKVKGRSGVKYKKSFSKEDEKRIVSSWGLDPEMLKTI